MNDGEQPNPHQLVAGFHHVTFLTEDMDRLRRLSAAASGRSRC
jgi:hypothetical protein